MVLINCISIHSHTIWIYGVAKFNVVSHYSEKCHIVDGSEFNTYSRNKHSASTQTYIVENIYIQRITIHTDRHSCGRHFNRKKVFLIVGSGRSLTTMLIVGFDAYAYSHRVNGWSQNAMTTMIRVASATVYLRALRFRASSQTVYALSDSSLFAREASRRLQEFTCSHFVWTFERV